MKPVRTFDIVELDEFTGSGAAIYSISIDDDEDTSYDHFLATYQALYPDEIRDILKRLNAISRLGAQPHYFKDREGEWGAGDGLVALFDLPDKNLRLYCIRYGTFALIVGGGGPKPKTIRALQDDPILTEENYRLRTISARITQAIRDGDLYWDGNYLDGRLRFEQPDLS